MRIFLDANVLVTVVNKEYPNFSNCAKILSLADRPGFEIFASSLSVAIAWYFADKKHGAKMARQKLEILLNHISISDCGSRETQAAISLINAEDFEDAMQYFSALHSECGYIITSNTSDYYFSDIPIHEPEQFLRTLY